MNDRKLSCPVDALHVGPILSAALRLAARGHGVGGLCGGAATPSNFLKIDLIAAGRSTRSPSTPPPSLAYVSAHRSEVGLRFLLSPQPEVKPTVIDLTSLQMLLSQYVI